MLSVEAPEHPSARHRYPQYRAPAGDNTALIEPPLAGRAVVASVHHWKSLSLGSRSLGELAQEGRRQLVDAATRYTSTYRDVPALPDVPSLGDSRPLLLTGHQAELFHPGVWFKNFVASRLAAESQGVAIHLVIDTDLCRRTSLRVPTGSVESPRVEAIPFDTPRPPLPYEERSIDDWHQFASFGERVAEAISPLVRDPLIRQWWPQVVDRARDTGRLGLGIAQARHLLEGEWGLETLEVPQSHVCHLPVFHWFAVHVLHDIESFRKSYNGALGRYREAHSLRNPAQPLPDLAQEDEWQETPFWIWTAADPQRRALFVRHAKGQIELTDLAGWQSSIPQSSHGDYTAGADALAQLAGQGIRLRTRALATTLFSRLLLGDLFLHGIGGAKYDQVTDDLACDWLKVDLPPLSALSATLRLPIEHPRTSHADVAALRHKLRELDYHPERYLPREALPAATPWIEQKRQAIATRKTPANAARRHQQITAANAALKEVVAPERERLEAAEPERLRESRVTQLLASREYAFCLFPEGDLRERLWRLATDQAT
jgi:hypothetical protein